VICLVAGGLTFVIASSGGQSLRAWQAYLVNFLFWTGMASGAVLFSAMLNVTGAKWGRPMKRLAEGFAAFLPVAFILYWLLYFGRSELFYWVRQPNPQRAAWLNVPFFFIRDAAALLCMTAFALALALYSVRGDRHWSGTSGTEDAEGRWADAWRKQQIVSPALIIAFAFLVSLLGFDLIMSLDPVWYSTLFGGYFLVGSFYSGIVCLYLLSTIVACTESFKPYAGKRLLHDQGKLVMAFCIFTGYLFYAQFLTIWYGNLPEEARYVILRVKLTPWEPLAWAILFMIFLGPLFILLSRRVKVKRIPVIILSIVILVGMWLERFILVVPSLWKQDTIPIGMTEVLVTAGFFGIVGLSVTAFLQRVPLFPVSDPLFRKMQENEKEKMEP
jgi:Ni/Fe-hydrogenase subunit HybB-like protein